MLPSRRRPPNLHRRLPRLPRLRSRPHRARSSRRPTSPRPPSPSSHRSSEPALPAEEGEHADDGDRHQAEACPERVPGVDAGEVHVHPEEAGEKRQRQQHDAEDREHVEDVVLLVRDQRLVRVLERLHDFLVVVEQVPDALARVDEVVEVELELLRQELPLDLPLELPQRRPLRLDDLAVGDDLLLDLVDVGDEVARALVLADRLVDLLELEADLVEDREAVVVEVVEHLVEEAARAAREELVAEVLVLLTAAEEEADRAQLDRGERDEVVRADEGIELPGVETADGRVVDREVEDGEEVTVVAVVVAGVDVDLGALAPREDVLDVERVPAEAAGEKLRLSGGRGEEVDPGDAAGLELSRRGPRLDDRSARRSAARTDARQAGHWY